MKNKGSPEVRKSESPEDSLKSEVESPKSEVRKNAEVGMPNAELILYMVIFSNLSPFTFRP